MEQENQQQPQEEQTYTPRPRWQVWSARVGLVVFIIIIVLYYINISRGGI